MNSSPSKEWLKWWLLRLAELGFFFRFEASSLGRSEGLLRSVSSNVRAGPEYINVTSVQLGSDFTLDLEAAQTNPRTVQDPYRTGRH